MRNLILLGIFITNIASAGSFVCKNHIDYGLPEKSDQLLCYEGFAVGFNYETKLPSWVAYKVSSETVTPGRVDRKPNYHEELAIPIQYRTTLKDYKTSKLHHVQLAPPSIIRNSKGSIKDTFLLINVVPKLPISNNISIGNSGAWFELTQLVRSWILERGNIYVVAGPVYLGPKKSFSYMDNGVGVPSHLFKIIYDSDYERAIAFLVPQGVNTRNRLPTFITSIDCIEHITGFDFLSKIDSRIENDIENDNAYDLKYWSMRDNRIKKGSCSELINNLVDNTF